MITEALEWVRAQPDFFRDDTIAEVKDSRVQVTVGMRSLRDPHSFGAAFASALGGETRLQLVRSKHSLDICLADACKTSVARAAAGKADDAILCIGDSGARDGNDHALLGSPYGISVGEVCDRAEVCWSFFGTAVTGPEALFRILRALRFESEGQVRLAVEDLTFCI